MFSSTPRHLFRFLPIGCASVALLTIANAQPHYDGHHDDYVPGVRSAGGLHPPHYPGVPHHARDIVRLRTESESVVFYSLGHGDHRDYYCIHPGHHAERIPFGTQAHVHDLAHGLKDFMNLFHDDMVANYRHNRGFDTVDEELHGFLECVERLDSAAAQNDIDAAVEELRHFYQDLLHLENDVRGWHRHHHQQIGRGGLLTKIFDSKVTIAHLANDLGTEVRAPHPVHPPHGGPIHGGPIHHHGHPTPAAPYPY